MTGCNEAFVVDNNTKDALISEHPSSALLLKKILRGRDVSKFQSDWNGSKLWLIATFPSLKLDINEFPAIQKFHLLLFGRDRLEQSGTLYPNGNRSRKKTGHQWFELQDSCAYRELFDDERSRGPI